MLQAVGYGWVIEPRKPRCFQLHILENQRTALHHQGVHSTGGYRCNYTVQFNLMLRVILVGQKTTQQKPSTGWWECLPIDGHWDLIVPVDCFKAFSHQLIVTQRSHGCRFISFISCLYVFGLGTFSTQKLRKKRSWSWQWQCPCPPLQANMPWQRSKHPTAHCH